MPDLPLTFGPGPAGRLAPDLVHQPSGRDKLWRIDPLFHCSIIGTCLGTGELRKLVARITTEPDGTLSDHDIHHRAVAAAASIESGGKILHKALDQRHAVAIRRFERARSEQALEEAWEAAKREGDIPGGYWAVFTHRLVTRDMRTRAFGDVHMLSHLVGAANRADIRKLALLEGQNTELAAKVERQERRLRESLSARDDTIRRLSDELARHLAQAPVDGSRAEAGADEQLHTLQELVRSLQRKLNHESGNPERARRRLAAAEAELDRLRADFAAVTRERDGMRAELEVFEAQLADAPDGNGTAALLPQAALNGKTLLYVGGRPGAVNAIAHWVEQSGGILLHHDGGIEDRRGRVAADVHRADLVAFPIDCVSHDAVAALKRACRSAGKPYYPLRNASLTCLVGALGTRVDSLRTALHIPERNDTRSL